MKATKLISAVFMMAAVALSCAREVEVTDNLPEGDKIEVRAFWAQEDEARTVLADNGLDILWAAADTINLFYGNRFSGKFISSNAEPQAVVNFSGTLTLVTGSMEQGGQSSSYWAVYPYNQENSCEGESVTLAVSDKQTGVAGTFADKFFPAVARSSTLDLPFYNVCGGARFSVESEGVTSIVFKSNDGSPMAGKVKVGLDDNYNPRSILEIPEPVDSVVVFAPDGGFIPAANYFAAMLPQTHEQGLTITLYKGAKKATRSLDKVIEVKRSIFGTLDNIDEGLGYTSYALPEIVDLGLPSGLKWASFNLGATKPEEYGDYFAWGETEPKSNYSWSTYKFELGTDYTGPFSKYVTNSSYGTVDNKTVLDPEDDAATVNLGGSWRMPTKAEQDELRSQCTWTWTTRNGINGRLVTGPNGNSIFLPAAGLRSGASLYDAGSYGGYWSSSLNTDLSSSAYYVDFDSASVNWHYYDRRYYGQSVRPVYGARIHVQSVSLDKTTLTLLEGESATLTATVAPSNAAEQAVTWTSSNTEVATVSSEGVVSGVSAGTAVITATTVDGGFAAECTVTVKEAYMAQTPEPVDLGLSVKWASFNLGATAPEEYGDYFAWGETEPKEDYSWSTYKWCKGSKSTMTKYSNNSSYGYNGYTDNKTVLDPEDDAATVNLGGSWRMPTIAEQDELISQCTWTWTSQNGVNGRLVTGPNGNSIFLPAAGYRDGVGLNAGYHGRYWSSSLGTDRPDYAYFGSFLSGYVDWRFDDRFFGFSVRPVSE